MILLTLLYLLVTSSGLLIYRRVSRRGVEVERVTIERLSAFLANGEGDVAAIGRGVAPRTLVECVVFVAQMVDGSSINGLRIVVRYYHIESYLLAAILASRTSLRRAYLLSLLARLPISEVTAHRVEHLVDEGDEYVSLYALMAIFAASPSMGVVRLSQMRRRLSRRGVAEILSMLSRGSCSIPYTPLLMSANYNLQLLGIYLVRRFGIRESRGEIMCMVRGAEDELRDDALLTLASFGEGVDGELVKQHIV